MNISSDRRRQAAAALLALLLSANAAAQQGYGVSDNNFCSTDLNIPPRPLIDSALAPGDTYMHAERAELIEQGISHLHGNAELSRDGRQVRAADMFYDRSEDTARLSGDVRLWDETLYLQSDNADIDLDNGSGVFENADYYLLESRGRGHAEELFIDAGELTKGDVADFTTCDAAKDAQGVWDLTNNFWRINAKELLLNHETDRGIGRHVVLKIKDVPVFYSPYLTFPLSHKRKSGFLMPSFGTASNSGLELRTPFYWNMAPDHDATLTPRLVADRGFMGMAEYRYLTDKMRGLVNVEYLPGDNVARGRDRSLFQLQHEQHLFGRGVLRLDYNRVSDKRYFQDLGSQLSDTSRRYLPQLAEFYYRASTWQLHARIQGYQTVDEGIAVTSKPYKRLPQVQLSYQPLAGANRINVQLRTEAVYFDRTGEAGLVNDVRGLRLDVFPVLSYPYQTQAVRLTPTIGLRYTRYELSDSALFPSSPSRLLPVVSVDGELIFDRYIDLFDADYLHTLEPRLYYLYVPDEDQSRLPVFDTGVYDASYDSLFRPDRFSSADRMGDANQITAAVTSRLINLDTGNETAYIRIAQTYRLDAQDVITQAVTADGRLIDSGVGNARLVSPLIAELGASLVKDWIFKAELQWEPQDDVTEKLALQAQYRPGHDNGMDNGQDKVLNFSYRVRRAASGVIRRNSTDIDQADVSFSWPLGRQWRALGRWNYAVSEARSLDLFAGLEYNSCCFAIRAVGRRFLTNLDGDFTSGVFLQFQFKGLAGLGQRTVDFLSQSIPGYADGF